MGTLNIGGKLVTVDDSFRNLSPSDQQKTVDEISSKIGVNAQTANPFDKFDPVPSQSADNRPIRVTGPDGATILFPANTDMATMEKALQEHYADWGKPSKNVFDQFDSNKPPANWSDLPGNILPSAGRMLSGFGNMALHPVQTAQTMEQAAVGSNLNAGDAVKGYLPNGLKWLGDLAEAPAYLNPLTGPGMMHATMNPSYAQNAKDTGAAVTGALADRYGGLDNMKRTAIQDPVGSLLDISTLAAGGEGLLARAGLEGTRATELASMISKATNPVNLTTGLVGKTATLAGKALSYPIAPLSGVSPEALQMAARAGQEGGDASAAFRTAMRSGEAPEAIVNDAKTALGNLAEKRRANYLAGMQGTASSSAVVDTAPIRQTLNDLRDSLYVAPKAELGDNAGSFSPLQKGSASDIKTLDQIDQLLTQWEAHPEGRTPLALDALKQRLDEFQPAFGNPALDNQRRLVTRLQNAIKDQISAVEPSYSKAMADYSTSKSAQAEIEKSLSLGRSASADSSLNRLKTVIGGNKANRVANVAELEAQGAPNLMNRLAGQSLSQLEPKGGLAKLVATALTGSSWWNPTHLAALPVTSPRFVGELAHAIGRTGRGVEMLAGHLPTKSRLAQILLGGQVLQGANGR